MGRIYAITYNGTITNAGGNSDLVSIQPADDKPVRLRGIVLSQTSEVGDAAEENLRITVHRMGATFTVGSGGSAASAAASQEDSGDTWGFTARCNDTAVATTSGTDQIVSDLGWNERNTPFDFWYPDERFAPKAKQGEAIVVRMESTPADDFTGSFTFFVEEL
jgi:hypothetical protein